MRATSAPAVRPNADGSHPIAAMPPLKLDPAAVASVGVVRASFDAVRDDARVNALKAAAKAESQKSYEAALAASANLARRTATAYARRGASFTRPEAMPPF